MKKQRIYTIIYLIILAMSLFAFMGFFFLEMRKTFIATLFINYWLILALTVSNIFVFFHFLKNTFGKTIYNKKFFTLYIEVIIAWILILILVIIASLVCWQDYFSNTFIPSIANTTKQLQYLIQLFLSTTTILVFLAVLVLPQFIFLCRRLIDYCKLKKATHKN